MQAEAFVNGTQGLLTWMCNLLFFFFTLQFYQLLGTGLDVNNTVGLNMVVSHESEAKLPLFIEYILIDFSYGV